MVLILKMKAKLTKTINFFTGKTVQNDFLLVKLIDYLKMNDFSKWKEIFIDPGVYDLTKSKFYSWEKETYQQTLKFIVAFLDSLHDDHYFSWDYPCDMNLEYQDFFINKTWENACHLCYHPQYIVTTQYKYNNYWDFVKWFNRYNNLEIKSGILGLGNMCRFRTLNQYLEHALSYAFYRCKHPRIHIYGLCLRAIPYAYNLSKKVGIELTIDSTKWTKACNTRLKNKYGVNCTSHNRQEFFNEYIKIIKKILGEID